MKMQPANETMMNLVDELVAARGGDYKALIIELLQQNQSLAVDLDRCLDAVSEGYVRGRPARAPTKTT